MKMKIKQCNSLLLGILLQNKKKKIAGSPEAGVLSYVLITQSSEQGANTGLGNA